MSTNDSTPKWKLMLIPILLVILIAVVWNNFRKPAAEDTLELLNPTSVKKPFAASNWQLGKRDIAISFNPFNSLKPPQLVRNGGASPSPTVDPNNPTAVNDSTDPTQSPAQSLDALASKPVTLLIRKGKKEIAVIGDQVIRSGQTLESGYQVDSIDMKRILLSNPDGQITLPTGNSPPQN